MEEPINWREYWQVLVEQKKLFGIITAAATLLALLTALIIPSIYRAEVLLVSVRDENVGTLGSIAGQFGDIASLAGIDLAGKKDRTAEHIAALKSRALAVAFMNQENVKPVLFPGKWDKETNKWKGEVPSDWKAFEEFDKQIRFVNVDRRTGLVTLAIEWRDPVLAAKWANALVRHVNDRLRKEATEEAERSIGYLEKQLSGTSSVEVQQAIYRLIEAQTKKKMIASTREEYAFNVVDPAVTPEKKHRPRRVIIVLVGLLLGLIVAVSVALVLNRKREHNDRSTG